MTPASNDTTLKIQTFSVALDAAGQITVPAAVQDQLNLLEGDQLTLLQIGDLVLITPKSLQTPQLIDQIVAIREQAGLSLTQLLDGLQVERQAIWQEHQPDA
jgi:AbrB family looped-hinge helix DNA binding protein